MVALISQEMRRAFWIIDIDTVFGEVLTAN
jgi:hypothetical protein